MEQVLDWLNENERRDYPLQENSSQTILVGTQAYTLPHNFILDLQLKISVELQLEANPKAVYLKHIQADTATELSVCFGTAESNLAVFSLAIAEPQTYPIYVRTEEGQLGVFGEGSGELLDLCVEQDILGQQVVLNIPVEPTTCIQFNDAWLGVSTISGAPAKRTTTTTDFAPELPLYSLVQPLVLSGDIQFIGGYNFRVAVSKGALDLEISDSYGLRMNCSTTFIAPEYLDCGDLISYINGVPPDSIGSFRLTAGTNVNIVAGNAVDQSQNPAINLSNQHTLFVGLSFQATDLCAPINLTPVTT